MTVWDYVSRNTFDSPDNQIKLLTARVATHFKKKKLKILDAGGGLVSRSNILSALGDVTVLDIVPGYEVDIVGDIHALPMRDKSYDLITLFMVMEHLHDPLVALSECARVLCPGGMLIGTTVQYWHGHAHPFDYYRYTRGGLEHIFKQAHLEIVDMWSSGGPFLVLYHVLELNSPSWLRKLIMLTSPIFNYLDKVVYNHHDKRENNDSVGWSFVLRKRNSK